MRILLKYLLLIFILGLYSCSNNDLEDDVENLRNQINEYKEHLNDLLKNKFIVDIENGEDGYIVYLSDGSSLLIKNGQDGDTPYITIGSNGNWFINGEDTGKPSQGNDGSSPDITIGSNGNWFINGEDTGKPSQGNNGIDSPFIIAITEYNDKFVFYFSDSSTICVNKVNGIFYDVDFSRNGYIDLNGYFISHSDFKTTSLIDKKLIYIDIEYDISQLGSFVNFYDSNGNWLQEESKEYCKDGTFSDTIRMPERAHYMTITSNSSYKYSAKYLSTNDDNIRKINKNVNWVGHSIWWYDGNRFNGDGSIALGYQTLLCNQFQFLNQSGTEYCYSGYSLGGINENDTRSILYPSTIDSWKESKNAIWTLDVITNDFKRDIPIGTFSDYENNTGRLTFYGALRVFKDKVYDLSGDNVIVVCSNALRRNNSGYTSTSKNKCGYGLVDYEHAMMDIASRNGWYFVDQYRLSGITDETLDITTIDGLHLNNFGYKLAVIPWISTFDYIYHELLQE